MIRIVIVGEHQTGEESIKDILASHYDFKIVGQGKDGYDALRLTGTLKPDIAILHERLHLLKAEDAVPVIKARSPKTRIIIQTASPDGEHILKAIRNGSSGYIDGSQDRERLIAGIKLVHHGGSLMSCDLVAKAFNAGSQSRERPKSFPGSQPEKLAKLTRRELKLIAWISRGLTNKEISQKLGLTDGTTRNYMSQIYQKIGLRNRTETALLANQLGITG